MKRFFALSLMLLTINAFSQVPQTMSFQGILTDPVSGDPIADDNYLMIFRIFDAETAGNEVWTETHDVVVVVNGLYNVILGSEGTVLPTAEFNKPLWLEVQVGTETLAPRFELSSSPYALTANSVAGGEHIIPASGNVGIGTTTPFRRLHVSGDAVDDGVYIRSQNTNPAGWSSFELRNDASLSYRLNLDGSGSAYPNSLYFYDSQLGLPTFLINPSGNVGIGTTDPFAKLHVQGTSTGGIGMQVENLDASGRSSLFLRNDVGHQYSLSVGGSANTRPNSLYIFDNVFGGSRLILNESGNLGIGTDTPASKLEVAGTVTSTGIKMVDGNEATGKVLKSNATGDASWQFLSKNTLISNLNNDIPVLTIPADSILVGTTFQQLFALSSTITTVDATGVLEVTLLPNMIFSKAGFDMPQIEIEIRINSMSSDFGSNYFLNVMGSSTIFGEQKTLYWTGLGVETYTIEFFVKASFFATNIWITEGAGPSLLVMKELGQ